MGKYINVGNERFKKTLNTEYVDKSGLIAVVNSTLNTEKQFSCVILGNQIILWLNLMITW